MLAEPWQPGTSTSSDTDGATDAQAGGDGLVGLEAGAVGQQAALPRSIGGAPQEAGDGHQAVTHQEDACRFAAAQAPLSIAAEVTHIDDGG